MIMDILIALGRATDIMACTIWLSVLHPLGLADKPTGRETISAYVGRAANNDMPWGLRAAAAIDRMATWVGEDPGHCQRAYEFYVLSRLFG